MFLSLVNSFLFGKSSNQGCHCEAIVKVHGVLPSSRWYSTSSWRIQFHRVHAGDSGVVITPFVQVATHVTTLPLRLGFRYKLARSSGPNTYMSATDSAFASERSN